MSDDRIVELGAHRVRAEAGALVGTIVFANQELSLVSIPGGVGPEWTLRGARADLSGRGSVPVHPQFSSLADSPDDGRGYVSESEHGLTAQFQFDPAYFDVFQNAALSAAELVMTVGFAAKQGAIEVLTLSIERKTA